jgi:hypothetical protein
MKANENHFAFICFHLLSFLCFCLRCGRPHPQLRALFLG